MEFTLYKTTEGFIITSDEEIKEGDTLFGWINILVKYIRKDDDAIMVSTDKHDTCSRVNPKSFKKVIAQQDQIDFSALSEEEQKEIGWVDIDFIVKDICGYDKNIPLPKNDNEVNIALDCLKRFQKSQELLSDRSFTLEDMRKALIEMALITSKNPIGAVYRIDEIIQSLSLPKSWKVELEMEIWNIDENLTSLSSIKPNTTNGKLKILKLL